MKRSQIIVACLFLAAATIVDCGGKLGLPFIGVSLDIPAQTIPGVAGGSQSACDPLGNVVVNSLTPISFDIRASKELRGKSVIRFTRVVLDHITLTIIPPSQASQNWDFVDSIQFFANAPGQAPVLVAELNPVPNGKREIEIPGTGVDLSDFASRDNFEVSGQATGRPPCADVHFDGSGSFDVSI